MPTLGTVTDMVMTTASLADAAGRSGTVVNNTTTKAEKVLVYAAFELATGTPAGLIKIYLIRHDNHATEYRSAGVSASDDQAISTEPRQAKLVGAVYAGTAGGLTYRLDTTILNPGPEWNLVVWNACGIAFSSTEANSYVHFIEVSE